MGVLTDALLSIRSRLTSDRTVQLLEKTRLYGICRWAWRRLWVLSKPDEVTFDVSDAEVELNTDTIREYKTATDALDEKAIIEDVLAHVESDDVVYDVGAHIGVFTCPIGDKLNDDGSDGVVVAFEANPQNVEKLRENVIHNGLEEIVDVEHTALSDETGTVGFAIETAEAGATHGHIASGDAIEGRPNQREITDVPMTTGDSFASNSEHGAPDVIKIDVEGAELRVLEGLKDIIATQECRLVYCEIHELHIENYGAQPDDVLRYLSDNGYSVTVIKREENNQYIRAERS